MADYLTVDGWPIPVREGAGSQSDWEVAGERIRMYDNSLASSINPLQTKRVWTFATPPMMYAELRVILAILRLPGARQAEGYAINRALGALSQVVHVVNAAGTGAVSITVSPLTYPVPAGTALGGLIRTAALAKPSDTVIATDPIVAPGVGAGSNYVHTLDAAEPASVAVVAELGEVGHIPERDTDIVQSVAFKLHEV